MGAREGRQAIRPSTQLVGKMEGKEVVKAPTAFSPWVPKSKVDRDIPPFGVSGVWGVTRVGRTPPISPEEPPEMGDAWPQIPSPPSLTKQPGFGLWDKSLGQIPMQAVGSPAGLRAPSQSHLISLQVQEMSLPSCAGHPCPRGVPSPLHAVWALGRWLGFSLHFSMNMAQLQPEEAGARTHSAWALNNFSCFQEKGFVFKCS